MPIAVEEFYQSRLQETGDNGFVDIVYVVRGSSDDAEVRTAVENVAAADRDGYPRQFIRYEPQDRADLWLATVHYAPTVNQASGGSTGRRHPTLTESVYSFDTGGGTQHITHSLGTVAAYAPPDMLPPNFGGAINATRDGVEGLDIVAPVFHFSEEHLLPAAMVTDEYKGKLFRLTGRQNGSTFRGLAAGECLFLGASGTRRGDDNWQIAYRFAGSENAANLVIGDITVVQKAGWDYLWVYFEQTVSAGRLIQRPAAAYVERVYRVGNFADLGI